MILSLGFSRLLRLWRRQATSLPPSLVFYGKLGLGGLTALLAICHLIVVLVFRLGGLDLILDASLNILVFLLALGLTHQEHLKSRIASSVLLLFWLSEVLVQLVILRTNWLSDRQHTSPLLFAFTIQYLLLSAILFILELIPKPMEYYSTLDEDEHTSPEEHANIFSRLSFAWMDSLMKLGYKKVLDMDDLWNLKKVDTAEFNSEKFQNVWTEELIKKRYFIWYFFRKDPYNQGQAFIDVRHCQVLWPNLHVGRHLQTRSRRTRFCAASVSENNGGFLYVYILNWLIFFRWNLQRIGLHPQDHRNPSQMDSS